VRFSERWLREWVDPDVDSATLCEQLTNAGLEVDGVSPAGSDCAGVVVGEVLSVAPHPHATRLTVCEVTDGSAPSTVVCGAPNVRVGLKAPLARIGAELAGNAVTAREVRGIVSAGRLCSRAELDLGDDDSGLLELPESARPGVSLSTALHLDDLCIELDLTPNRGDCLSLRGIAREVGVLNDAAVHAPTYAAVEPTIDATFPVSIEAGEGCPRYLGRVIEGIDINAATPFWMAERLRRCGIRSIDPVVDVTNYVMVELGQPMHAFDVDRLVGGIVVRGAGTGETLKLLDGREAALEPDMLVIADDGGPVAVAGVMGGARSKVGADTVNVFLECAFFAPLAVAASARRLNLHTDASHRYERGVDFELQRQATERATALLLEIVGGRAGPVRESVAAQHLPARAHVTLRQARLNELAGATIPTAAVDAALSRLDFRLVQRDETEGDGVVWTIAAPSHRFDIQIEADLVEEVCRIHGYQRIPSRLPSGPLAPRRLPLRRSGEHRLKRLLAANGFQEVITYSFVDPVTQELLDPQCDALPLANPMSAEQAVMRTNLLPGLIEAARHNAKRQQRSARLFELGACFQPADSGAGGKSRQTSVLGGLLWGERAPESWHAEPAAVDFFDLKGQVEQLLAWSGVTDASFERSDNPVLHPGQRAAVVVGGRPAGWLGRLHPELERRLGLSGGVFVFELPGELVLASVLRRYSAISKMPSVRRDLSLVVDERVTAEQLRSTVRKALGEVLVEFTLFDVYRGKSIDSNETSIAIGLTLQRPSATLAEADISVLTAKAITALSGELGARLR